VVRESPTRILALSKKRQPEVKAREEREGQWLDRVVDTYFQVM